MTDDEIAERVAAMIWFVLVNLRGDPMGFAIEATNIMDTAEAYRLAFIADVRERAKTRREAARVRRLVFAKLGVADRVIVEK